MKKSLVALGAGALLAGSLLAAQTTPGKLQIYVVDVEGGKADLWVTPSGQSMLIDTGFAQGNRDVDRIMEVINAAGVKQLDYLLSTHYHLDHVGGLQELVKRIPVGTFLDHGPTVEDGVDGHQAEQVRGFQAAYAEIYGKAKHIVLKVGDRIPLTGVDWRIVTSAGAVQKTPLAGAPGAGAPNPACATTQRQDVPRDPENGQSVGSVITFGGFRAIDLGDLTQDKEYDMMCPSNPIGTVDLYFASNHGTNNAGSPLFIDAIAPRVAIAQNGSGKGASMEMFQTLHASPRLLDVWLMHWANPGGLEWNSPGAFIANGMDPATIATTITAPPRGAGGGRGQGGPGGGAPGAGPGAAGAPGGGGGFGGGGRGQGGAAPAAGAAPAGGAAPANAPAAGQAAVAPQAGAPAAGPGGPGGGAPGAGGPGGGGGQRGGGGGGAGAHTPAYWLKVEVDPSGTFTITNTRNNFSKTYMSAMSKIGATPMPAAAPAPARSGGATTKTK